MNRRTALFCTLALGGSLAAAWTAWSVRPGGALARTEVGHVATLFRDMDRLEVDMEPGVDPAQVDVDWVAFDGDVRHAQRVRLFHAGRMEAPMPREYGENGFEFRSGGRILLRRAWMRVPSWHYNRYRFLVRRAPGGLSAALDTADPILAMSAWPFPETP